MRRKLRQSFRAAAESPGISLAVLFGILSLVLPPLVGVLPRGSPWLLTTAAILGVAALAMVTAVPIAGAIALRTLPPAAYAQIMVGGRPVSEVLLVLSEHIATACEEFLRATEPVDRISRRLSATGEELRASDGSSWKEARKAFQEELLEGGPPVAVRSEIAPVIRTVRSLRLRQHGLLQRILEMKHLAAHELGIPSRRLCDHLLQYSPAIHQDRTLKYLNNWRELQDSVASLSSRSEVRRFGAVAAQNVGIRQDAENRAEIQQKLQANTVLHPFLQELASIHSTSGSLQSYARLLAYVARRGRTSLDRSRFKGDPKHPAYQELEDRFLFAHRKQRAHPGVDLNTTLIRACEEIRRGLQESTPRELDPDRVDDHLFVLNNLAERARTRDGRTLLFESGPHDHVRRDEAHRRLASLELLPSYLTRHMVTARDAIIDRCQKVLTEWFRGAEGTPYLVSHGYSKTVREVLRRSRLGGGVRSQPPVYLVIADEQDEFDTRRMEYELTERLSHRTFGTIGSGELAALQGVIEKDDRILVLLGAECFDASRRVVHPRGMARVLAQLLDDPLVVKGRVRVLVIVVAEHYKLEPDSLTRTELFDDHLDRIDLYRPDHTHLVVTDREIFPEAWQAELDKRLQASGPTEPTHCPLCQQRVRRCSHGKY